MRIVSPAASGKRQMNNYLDLLQLRMKKDKDPKQTKRNALASFLQASTTQASSEIPVQSAKPVTEQEQAYEEYVQQLSNCNVCGCDLDKVKMKKCEFCTMPACNDHLRKKRKKKGKWEKICDNCQDKYLYDIYMKLQSKADEALGVEEQITILKHQNFLKEAEQRREKRRQIGFKTMALKEHYEKQITKISNEQNKLMSYEHQVESAGITVSQLQAFVQRANSSFKDNNQESWNILSEENARMAKELTKLQKKIYEVKTTIEKRQKQIEDAFELWQQRQFKKKLQNEEQAALRKKKQCQIY